MALFDNPHKELQRLQAELLAEEDPEEAEFFQEEDEFPEEYADAYPEEPYSEGGFTRNMTEVLMEEEADAHRAVYYEETPRRRPGCFLAGLLILAFLIGGWLAWMR